MKYRPRTFEDVVGQPEKAHLRLMMRDRESFPPVVIFRGPSGTGKTTLARITAAALNCLDLGPKGDPCTVCDNCVAAHDGNLTGVYEHNAAIENGADAMRSIQERTFLYPQGTHNVFILDEVQCLSSQAWKVLLKTFEEPVPGSVFILVTSEPTKIPRTIQTRAISYDFGRVGPDNLRDALTRVLTAEQASVEGLDLIIDLSEGSVRDAIKMAEQCSRSNLSAYQVFEGRDTTLEIWEGIAANDMGAALRGLHSMWTATSDAQYITERLGAMLQRVMYEYYGIPQASTQDRLRRLSDVSSRLTENGISVAMGVLATWHPRVREYPHVLFLLADLMKAIHGTKAADLPLGAARSLGRSAPETKKILTAEEVSSALDNLNLL